MPTLVTGETGMWGFGALGVGLNAEFYRAATPGRPYQVAISRDARCYHNQTVRPLNNIRWELFTLLAHGQLVTVVDKAGLSTAGWTRWPTTASAPHSAKHGEARALPATSRFTTSASISAARATGWDARTQPAISKAFRAHTRRASMNISASACCWTKTCRSPQFGSSPSSACPNTGILGKKEVALFRRYVEEGDKLLVTGQSGQFGRMSQRLADSNLGELIGAKPRAGRKTGQKLGAIAVGRGRAGRRWPASRLAVSRAGPGRGLCGDYGPIVWRAPETLSHSAADLKAR